MCKKVKKKKKKGNFLCDVFPRSFSNSDDKKGGKSKWFCFFPSGERENVEINYEKKEKNFFSPLGSFLTIFVVSFPEKMIRKFFGGKEKK